MTASELEKWLNSDASKSVGQKSGGGGESTDVEDTPWRYSLMNWGHDPAKN